ncbi:hypothetical protein ACFQO1_02180 [Jejudonia soesokkakensis]|uniref:TonB C-terminal domain-containing protein n=1 Tax=Jejudonia soesokkakensis TaxID=1323432 RepID=A0ABW2MUN8_9FLAO
MKLHLFFLIGFILFFAEGFAQSDFNKMVRDSEAFRNIAATLNLEPGSTHFIETIFYVEKDGSISRVSASSEYPEMKAEAIRIIKKLPKFEFSNSARPLNFPHKIGVPITYRVETEAMKKLRLRKAARQKKIK